MQRAEYHFSTLPPRRELISSALNNEMLIKDCTFVHGKAVERGVTSWGNERLLWMMIGRHAI